SSRARGDQPWSSNVKGIARVSQAARPTRRAVSPERFRARSMCAIPGPACYDLLAALGLQYGPSFQGVSELILSSGEALGRLSIPASVVAEQDSYHVHPAVLDACFHVLVGMPFTRRREAGGPFVPTRISRLCVYGPIRGQSLWSFARLVRQQDGILEGDL